MFKLKQWPPDLPTLYVDAKAIVAIWPDGGDGDHPHTTIVLSNGDRFNVVVDAETLVSETSGVIGHLWEGP